MCSSDLDLGDDESGNGNDFTETGIDATNQALDTQIGRASCRERV